MAHHFHVWKEGVLHFFANTVTVYAWLIYDDGFALKAVTSVFTGGLAKYLKT